MSQPISIPVQEPLHLFEGYGVELEYMIVSRDDLRVMPIADQLIHRLSGEYLNEIPLGEIALSNELALHVIELKTNGPSKSLSQLIPAFTEKVFYLNTVLAEFGAQLLPTGAHPWMNPDLETKLWPHGDNSLYEAFHQVFDCRGHGWTNMQSTHLNLPFGNEEEFVKLHSAIRLILPILPALSASTPIIEGKVTGHKDTRLDYYRKNQVKIPSITGLVIPEAIRSCEEYEHIILNKMYSDIDPYDPQKVLQQEWLNSRGAIARFSRNAIEIRILDIQESPKMDIYLLEAVVCLLKAMISERWLTLEKQLAWKERGLSELLINVGIAGLDATIDNAAYLKVFGYTEHSHPTVRHLWEHILDELSDYIENSPIQLELMEEALEPPAWISAIRQILQQGNLSERITESLTSDFSFDDLKNVYRQLGQSLHEGQAFTVLHQ